MSPSSQSPAPVCSILRLIFTDSHSLATFEVTIGAGAVKSTAYRKITRAHPDTWTSAQRCRFIKRAIRERSRLVLVTEGEDEEDVSVSIPPPSIAGNKITERRPIDSNVQEVPDDNAQERRPRWGCDRGGWSCAENGLEPGGTLSPPASRLLRYCMIRHAPARKDGIIKMRIDSFD